MNEIILNNIKKIKVIIFLLCLTPVYILVYEIIKNDLSANPIEYILKFSGKWSINFLMFSLAITPLRRIFKLNWLIKFRRMIGLFAFFYVFSHFLIWLGLDQGFELSDVVNEIKKRPFILIGFAAFIMMLPLALTSFNKAIKFLGGSLWQKIHNLVYVIGLFAVIHLYWIKASKNNLNQPILYFSIFLSLILIRVYFKYSKK